jgi:hypothetical protein
MAWKLNYWVIKPIYLAKWTYGFKDFTTAPV